MNTLFSKISTPEKNTTFLLHTVYVIKSDKSYIVKRGLSIDRKGYVAIRTLEGSGVIKIHNQSPITVSKGSILFFENQFVDSYFCIDICWNFLWYEYLCTDSLEFSLNELFHIEIDHKETPLTYECMDMLKINNQYSDSLASAIFSNIYHCWLLEYKNVALPFSNYNKAIQEIIIFMKSNLDKPMAINDFANKLGISDRRFRYIFKEITGYAPKKFIGLIRIEAAEELLETTSYSINKISEKLGYINQFHFSKAFSKAKGMSPISYRRKNIK